MDRLYSEKSSAEYMKCFKALKYVDIAKMPTDGEVSAQWVFDFADVIFGSLDPETMERRIKEFFLLIPKKNGKSTLAAAIMLTMLVKNWRTNAEFIIVSPTLNVSNNSFRPLVGMIEKDDRLKKLLNVSTHTKTITHRGTGATLRVLSARQDNITGSKATGILVDELWLFDRRKDSDFLFRELKGGLATRKDGFIIYLTTQADNPPVGVFKDILTKARMVHDGTLKDDTFYPVLYEYSQEEIDNKLYEDYSTWGRINPNLGLSVDFEFLKNAYETAKYAGESSYRNFLAKHLNIEPSIALRSNQWIGAEYIEQCEAEFSLSDLIENSDTIYVGIDGGGLFDFLGLAVLGAGRDGLRLWTTAWVVDSSAWQSYKNPELQGFVDAGELIVVDESPEDARQLADIISEIFDSEKLHMIGIDPAGIGAIAEELSKIGVNESNYLIGVRQGWTLGGAIKNFERLLSSKNIQVAKSGLFRYMVCNAVVSQRSNSILITKEKSYTKIDALMASLNAVELYTNNNTSGDFDEYLGGMIIA